MPMADVGRAYERSETKGFMKIIVDAETRQLIGAALLGIEGDEIVQGLLDMMYAKAPYTVIRRAMHIHPTVYEMIPYMFDLSWNSPFRLGRAAQQFPDWPWPAIREQQRGQRRRLSDGRREDHEAARERGRPEDSEPRASSRPGVHGGVRRARPPRRGRRGAARWKLWGPYLSERQWGTVREDYSPYGNAWDYFSHDQARSRAYRWGEDGIAGISDRSQRLCLALALWNGRDPILKERLFGLTNGEGNHGEDVKELYYYLDATPTHSYLKYLYKYPQAEFPYAWLVEENRRRGKAPSSS